MSNSSYSLRLFKPSLSFALLCALFAMLWIAGGASRGDALGQVFVRTAAWFVVIVAILLGRRPSLEGVGALVLLLLAAMLLPLAQLIPIPPELWSTLPGRDVITEIILIGQSHQPWRPISIAPGFTMNAASALVIPAAVLFLMLGLDPSERTKIVGMVLVMITASAFLGLMQVSGRAFSNPLVNDLPGEVSGVFANRNHFALFLSIGCLLIPAWCFRRGANIVWKGPVSIGLLILFLLTILASGSRAGMVLGLLAAIGGIALARQPISHMFLRASKWVRIMSLVAMSAVIVGFLLASFLADRAVSLSRAMGADVSEDMRARSLPKILEVTKEYFPVGSGFGTFDPAFRAAEPNDLLQIQYFNHAHNDLIEIVLEGGLLGLSLFILALGWWCFLSARVWRGDQSTDAGLGRLGSAIIFLIFLASIVDYPIRTPMIMAVAVIAALWLSLGAFSGRRRSALRQHDR